MMIEKFTKLYKRLILEFTVFICGAVVMMYELIGSRILAPYLGTSIYVWTGLIGVILGSLSLGYWYGGKVADKKPNQSGLALIIFLAGTLIALTLIVKNIIVSLNIFGILSVELASVLSSLLLFAPASVLLGMVSPYAVKLKLTNTDKVASTVGNLYAYSTVGSIVGTFSAGFFVIPFLGTNNIIVALSLILIILSVLVYPYKNLRLRIILLIFFSLAMPAINSTASAKPGFLEVDTQYNKIWLYYGAVNNQNVLALATDPFGTQSAMYLNSDELVFEYTKFYHLLRYFAPDFKKSLMIGGCAYSFPKDYLKKYPEATLDVVEIDPQMTEIAKKYFRLHDNERLKIIHQDGRFFLNQTKDKYDVILVDAFGSNSSIPHQLTTSEAIKKEYELLNENGVVLVNIISAIEGEKGDFLRAEYWTYKEIFPQVYLFPVNYAEDGERAQNLILVALKSQKKPDFTSLDNELLDYLNNLWQKDVANDLPILTDDFAPVEYYRKRAIKQ